MTDLDRKSVNCNLMLNSCQ